MKKVTQYLILFCISLGIFTSCEKDENIIAPVEVTIATQFDENFDHKKIQEVSITLKNTNSGDSYTIDSDTSGKAIFSVSPGNYNISATIIMTPAEFETFFGFASEQESIGFNGVLENITINDSQEISPLITLLSSRIGALVIKQVYYAGSDVKVGAMFRDIFYEIYNNSNETIYLDGLYFGVLYNNSSRTVKSYTLANGQLDWEQSIGQDKGAKSNANYCYADNIYQFPGDGKSFPLLPGKSTVVAGTAINHKEPLVIGDKTYTVQSPELVTDLSNADWEVNLIEYRKGLGLSPYITDIDNPNVPNIKIIHTVNKELILDPMGRDSFVIFSTKEYDSFLKVPSPKKTSVSSTTRFYVQIPNSIIIDGVETNKEDPASLYPRRISASIDGGYAFVPKGRFSSQAIIRKVKTTIGGRKILMDTNNSSNDFEVAEPPTPGSW